MNSVAAIVHGYDNNTYMVASCEKRLFETPESIFCPSCGWKIDWRYIRLDYRLGSRRWDVSTTYDGVMIVSKRVRELLQSHDIDDSVFAPLPLESEFFALIPVATVTFDYERRNTRRQNLCKACGLHSMVAGATPAFFKELPAEGAWIAHTDILFGSYNEHSPMIVVSEEISKALRGARFTGLHLETVKAEQVGGGNSAFAP